MGEKSIRFGVTDTKGLRAATWTCATPKSPTKRDIYLICRELGHSLKVSLHEKSDNPAPHEHGEWRIAYHREFFHLNSSALRSQVIDRWPRPNEIGPGVTLAFRIITPEGAITSPIVEDPKKKIEWIPAPRGSSEATETCIILTAPTTVVADWPGKNAMNSQLVGFLEVNGGARAWIVYRRIPMPELKGLESRTKGRFFQGHSRDTLRNAKNPRMLMFADMDDGSRAILEFGCKVNTEA